jgi:hypothetical protein
VTESLVYPPELDQIVLDKGVIVDPAKVPPNDIEIGYVYIASAESKDDDLTMFYNKYYPVVLHT